MIIDSPEDYNKLQALIAVIAKLLELKPEYVFNKFIANDMVTWTQLDRKTEEYKELIFEEPK